MFDVPCSFYGIPYGEAPVGSLRFAYPQAAKAWNSTLNATTSYPICIQGTASSTPISGVEDCLRVDVYMPANATSTSMLPVIVAIPGGM
jgi:carboxylesterase type B